MDYQLTGRGALILLGIVLFLITVYYGAALGTALVGGVIIFGGLYIVWVIGRRVNRRLIYGKRKRSNSGGEQ
jgi:thiol:disulfide interchange protein